MDKKKNAIVIPKKFKDMTDMYRLCRYEEANSILSQFNNFPHQISAIQAQLAFFRWDFNQAVGYILIYYPFLEEWYTQNMTDDTVLMLEYSLLHCSEKVKTNAIQQLNELWEMFEEGYSNVPYHIKKIPEVLGIANGNLFHYVSTVYSYKKYQESPTPKSVEDISKDYANTHKKQCKHLKGRLSDHEKIAVRILNIVKNEGDAQSYIQLYEKFQNSSLLLMSDLMDAVRIYQYLHEYDKAKRTIIELVKHQWYPVEWTDILPISALVGLDCFDLYTKDLFEEIMQIPRGISEELRIWSPKLECKHNFDSIFKLTKFCDYTLDTVAFSKLSVPSGRIVVTDPLVYLNKDTKAYAQKIAKGEYDVIALFATDRVGNSIIAAVKVQISIKEAVVYQNALVGIESQARINAMEDGDYIGFCVDSGIVAIMDELSKREYLKYMNGWEKEHKGQNFYTDYLSNLFEDSANTNPKHQRECGDYIDFLIPGTNYHVPLFASGTGNGMYPVYYGYDESRNPCSLIVEFVEIY